MQITKHNVKGLYFFSISEPPQYIVVRPISCIMKDNIVYLN